MKGLFDEQKKRTEKFYKSLRSGVFLWSVVQFVKDIELKMLSTGWVKKVSFQYDVHIMKFVSKLGLKEISSFR